MKIVFLGTGVSVASAKRGSPGLLIEVCGEELLFDCGSGTIKTLEKLRYEISDLKYLFITHFHLDHVCDYPAIVKDRSFTTVKDLCVFGPPGLKRHSDILFNDLFPYMAAKNMLNVFGFLEVKEIINGLVVKTEGWEVNCAPSRHAQGIAYRLDGENKSVLYSGDTSPCDSLAKLGEDVDIAILECSYPDKASLTGEHLTPEAAGELAQEMKAKKLYMTHLYPVCYGKEHCMVEKAKEYFDGEVAVAEDSLELKI